MRRSDPLAVRPFSPVDAGFVRRLAAEAFAEYDGGAGGVRVLAMAAARGAFTLVAQSAGQPAGFVVVAVDGARAHLGAIAVARGFRGGGVGQRLLRAAERRAEALGGRAMRLETGEANLAAMELFVRAGYERVGRIARYYRTGYDALVYRKRLGG